MLGFRKKKGEHMEPFIVWILIFVEFLAFTMLNSYLFLLGMVVADWRSEKDADNSIVSVYKNKISSLDNAIAQGQKSPLFVLLTLAAGFTLLLASCTSLPLVVAGIGLFLFFAIFNGGDKRAVHEQKRELKRK